MEYVKLKPHLEIVIDSIISVHYFEYAKDFAFSGEMHDFWEFVYADKDELFVTAGGKEFLLKAKQWYLHKPMEFHNIRCNGEKAASSVIVSFSCDNPILHQLAGRIIECESPERRLMATIINESRGAFSTPLGDPYTAELIRKNEPDFAAEQMIKNHLEILLIQLLRNCESGTRELPEPEVQDPRLAQVLTYLEQNAEKRIDFSDVCNEFHISGSYLKKLFQREVGCGVMEYYNRCKIDRAKQLIRERNINFTQIAARLEFNSVQYFSRCFRNHTGMTPSEYEQSVFSMAEPKNG